MKKEVLRLIRDSSAKSRQGIVSIALTLLVISVLLISAPAKAVTINLPVFADPVPENLPYDFQITIDIEGGEIVPVQTLELSIGAETCVFNALGSPISGCDSFNINRNMESVDDCSQSTDNLYGYGYGSADGSAPYDYAGTDFGYGYGGYTGDCSLTYDITWEAADVAGDTELPVTLKAYATNEGNDYYYVASSSLTIENVDAAIISAGVEEPDYFYSFAEGNNVVNVVVETSTSVTGVTADFGALGAIDCGDGDGDTILLTETEDNVWTGPCDVTDEAALADFVGGEVIITATDGITPALGGFGIVLYSMTTFPDAPCIHFGDASTNFAEQTDFSDINFVVDMEIDFSCWLGEGLPAEPPAWMLDFEPILLLEFESVNMSSPDSAEKIGDVTSYLDIDLTMPGEFGDSRIFIDSEYLAELDTDAEITIYHLPFTSAPDIVPDDGLVSPPTVVWTQGEGEGTLYFAVTGFSGYDITDNVDPSITISSPDTEYQRSEVDIDVRVDGTGTAVSEILIEVIRGSTVMFSYDIDDCEATDATNEVYTFSTTLSRANLPVGDYILRVNATDFGGDSGNTKIKEYSFKRRNAITSTGGGWIQSGSGWSFTMSVSNEQFMNGFRKVMGINQRFKFRYGGEDHYAGITSIDGNLVTITVWSDPQTATLAEGEYSRFDVDSDGYYDVYVEIGGVTGEVAEVTVQNIHEEVGAEPPVGEAAPPVEEAEPETTSESATCTSSWSCGDWGECLNGERARVCVDSSACGTIEGKPAEREACRTPVKLPWLTILLVVVIIAVISFAVIFFLHRRYEIEE